MAQPAVPLTFGRYEALFHVASGGMAEVFAARLRGPAGFEKLVAVKRLLPELADEHFVTMFLDEARLAAHISSPHVVQTLELGRAEDDGALYIVMELVVGVTLYDLAVSVIDGSLGALPIDVIAEILSQAARGLDDAHNATTPTGQQLHVIHRDISPQNILVGADGRVRVTDFGIARAVMRSTQTQAGQLKGKVAYVSPEQAKGKALDRRSDVFSLGVVAWECLTGRSLFNTGDPIETLDRVKDLRIPNPKELRPDCPDELATAVLWALSRDQEKRCPNAARFARAVTDAVPERPSKRKLANFVQQHAGKALSRIQERIQAVSSGREETVMRPAPTSRESSRIVPADMESGVQPLIGSPTEPPPALETASEQSRRVMATATTPAVPADGMGTEEITTAPPIRKPPTADGAKRLNLVTAIGVAAWLGAAALAYWTLAG
ncbi:MAG: serine/threonine protein kinase [Deltaproteobacteria bacterium]|nr:serine/threonine protein kinase [Deltaproteobacteria bacterium]